MKMRSSAEAGRLQRPAAAALALVVVLAGRGAGRLKDRVAEQEREIADLRALDDRLARELTASRAEAQKAWAAFRRAQTGGANFPDAPMANDAPAKRLALEALAARLSKKLAGSGAVVRIRGSRVVVRAPVAFQSGKATLEDGGRRLLTRIGKARAETAGAFEIGVAGHTDSSRILKSSTRQAFPTNWHLSGARARVAMELLMQASGFLPSRFHFRGYGEHRPDAENSTPEGRAANRRIEIILEPAAR